MVVALLALFIALAGTSYPAIKLPANSVGTKTIKNRAIHRADLAANAVDSARVADHTLLAGDFKAGQLPSGLPGPTGPKGDAGGHAPCGPHVVRARHPAHRLPAWRGRDRWRGA
jgi:hypothetical protein